MFAGWLSFLSPNHQCPELKEMQSTQTDHTRKTGLTFPDRPTDFWRDGKVRPKTCHPRCTRTDNNFHGVLLFLRITYTYSREQASQGSSDTTVRTLVADGVRMRPHCCLGSAFNPHCFETIDWVTGRTAHKNTCCLSSTSVFWNKWRKNNTNCLTQVHLKNAEIDAATCR